MLLSPETEMAAEPSVAGKLFADFYFRDFNTSRHRPGPLRLNSISGSCQALQEDSSEECISASIRPSQRKKLFEFLERLSHLTSPTNWLTFSREFVRSSHHFLEKSCSWKLLAWQGSFISGLCLLWSLLLASYMGIVDPFIPRVRAPSSLLQPGLAIRPHPQNVMSTLISFRHGGAGDWADLTSRFETFLQAYGFGLRAGNSQPCSWNTTVHQKTRCHVDNRAWMALDTDVPCTLAEHFGMYHGQPCLILKLNNVYGWEPQPYYNLSEVDALRDMPRQLKDHIRHVWQKNCQGLHPDIEQRCPQLRMVWLSCEGETQADTENMGSIYYTPWRGFPGFYYPYLNQDHYLSPLVFIQFRNITPGVLIQVRCKAWAKNIQHDPRNPRKGGIHFEILMD